MAGQPWQLATELARRTRIHAPRDPSVSAEFDVSTYSVTSHLANNQRIAAGGEP